MYKLETKDYPKVGEVVALCNIDEPRTVVAIAAVSGKEGQFDYAIDCGQLFDLNNKDPEGTTWTDDEIRLDGEIGWRHASREEFEEILTAVYAEGKNHKEFIVVTDRERMQLYTFTDRESYTEWLKAQTR